MQKKVWCTVLVEAMSRQHIWKIGHSHQESGPKDSKKPWGLLSTNPYKIQNAEGLEVVSTCGFCSKANSNTFWSGNCLIYFRLIQKNDNLWVHEKPTGNPSRQACPNVFTGHLGQLLRLQETGFSVANDIFILIQVQRLVCNLTCQYFPEALQ